MIKYFYLAVFIVLVVLIAVPMLQQPGKSVLDFSGAYSKPVEPSAVIRSEIPGVRLNSCSDEELGVRFLCDFGWRQRKAEGGVLYTIDDDPDVQMKMVRVDMDILFTRQLDRGKLEGLGRYAQGFATEELEVAGLNAIKVKAFSKEDADKRLSDYYFVHDQKLYGLMFSVAPKDRWDDYKFLFQDIVKNFCFEK